MFHHADTVQMLLSKGDDSSLRGAQAVTMRLAVVRGEAQRARHKSLADAAASPSATGEGTFNRVQAPQHPLLTTEAQRQRSEVLDAAADQLWSQLIVVRKKVDDKKAELAAALTSLRGAQESALCRHLEHHSNLLLQVTCLYICFTSSQSKPIKLP
jgi:flagellar motility protein MotE (MotC chaperone)